MERINIQGTDVILEDLGEGCGKVIVATSDNGNFSYYWGCMGRDLKSFLKSVDPGYFAGKLCNEKFTFSGKATASAIRRHIKNEMTYDLPWYKCMNLQKQLRKYIKEIEETDSQYEAFTLIENLSSNIYHQTNESNSDYREFISALESHFSDDLHYFLETAPSDEYKFLTRIHKQLKQKL